MSCVFWFVYLTILLTLWLTWLLVTFCFTLWGIVCFSFKLTLVGWSCVIAICSVVCLLYLLAVLWYVYTGWLRYFRDVSGLLFWVTVDVLYRLGICWWVLSLPIDVLCFYMLLWVLVVLIGCLLLLDFTAWFTGFDCELCLFCYGLLFSWCVFWFADTLIWGCLVIWVCALLCCFLWGLLVFCVYYVMLAYVGDLLFSLNWICVKLGLIVGLIECVFGMVNSNGAYPSLALDIYY